MQIDDGSGNGRCREMPNSNFKNTTRVLTIGDVSPDYRCHQYSNLTYPIGIGPLGCEYSRLLYSLSSFCVCSLSGLCQFSHSNTRYCPLYRSIPFGIPRILGRTYPVQADWNRIE